jgi:hypothetical protein
MSLKWMAAVLAAVLAGVVGGALVTALVLKQPAPISVKVPAADTPQTMETKPSAVEVVNLPQPPAPVPQKARLVPKRREFVPTTAAPVTRDVPVLSDISAPDSQAVPEIGTFILDDRIPPIEPKVITLKTGTLLQVRLAERLRADRNEVGDAFGATLDQPLVVDGWVVAERGARLTGHLVDIDRKAHTMSLELASLRSTDGQQIALRTARFVRRAEPKSRGEAVAKIGVAVAIGAAIGGAAGGGKGSAIGAGVGAAVGGIQAARANEAMLDVETRLSFRVEQDVVIAER